jgi:hypothetical protein
MKRRRRIEITITRRRTTIIPSDGMNDGIAALPPFEEDLALSVLTDPAQLIEGELIHSRPNQHDDAEPSVLERDRQDPKLIP